MSIGLRKINDLVVRLSEKTISKQVDWEVTASPDKYLTTSSNYSIIISEEGEQGDDYFLTITDELDELIDRVGDPELTEVNENAYHIMQNMFVSARRNARGVDKAIDDILESLG